MSIRYDPPRGQFFDDEGLYVPPGVVAERLAEAEAEVRALRAKQTFDAAIARLARMVAKDARSEP